MNKKAFTLIEIIVAIIIISVISTISIVSVSKKNKNTENIENKILEAANLYANIEKDNNGEVYVHAVERYAKGVKIPLSTLKDKGYIEESLIEDLDEDYYVLLSKKTGLCDDNAVYELSWKMAEDTPVYLCNNTDDKGVNVPIMPGISNNLITKGILQYHKSNELFGLDFEYNTVNNEKIYSYLGNVEDNYVKYGKDKDGNDLIWRIVNYITSDTDLDGNVDNVTSKLILNNNIPQYDIYNYEVTEDIKYQIYNRNSSHCYSNSKYKPANGYFATRFYSLYEYDSKFDDCTPLESYGFTRPGTNLAKYVKKYYIDTLKKWLNENINNYESTLNKMKICNYSETHGENATGYGIFTYNYYNCKELDSSEVESNEEYYIDLMSPKEYAKSLNKNNESFLNRSYSYYLSGNVKSGDWIMLNTYNVDSLSSSSKMVFAYDIASFYSNWSFKDCKGIAESTWDDSIDSCPEIRHGLTFLNEISYFYNIKIVPMIEIDITNLKIKNTGTESSPYEFYE